MEIQIDKNWKLTTDDMNVILCRRIEHKKKNSNIPNWKNVGYYQKIEHALDRLFDEKVYESGAISFDHLKAELIHLRLKVVSARWILQNKT